MMPAAHPSTIFTLLTNVTLICLVQASTSSGQAPATAFPYPLDKVAQYDALRANQPIRIDGKLDEACWQHAPRSPRFIDLVSAKPTIHDTRAAVLWDAQYLYVAFWVEEPDVQASLTKRDQPVYQNNDVECFIAGPNAYYEFEINAHGTIYDAFAIWQDAYESGGFAKQPEFSLKNNRTHNFNGVGFRTHPRGRRWLMVGWNFPELKAAVHIDGTLNQPKDRDRGWTAEVAFPWKGMTWLAKGDGRSLPPQPGDVWQIDFTRFNQYREAPPVKDSGGWAWSPHGVWDSHIPELFPRVRFVDTPVVRTIEAERGRQPAQAPNASQ